MATRKVSRVNPKYKRQYRVSNWSQYEALVGCHVLNRMLELGSPVSYAAEA